MVHNASGARPADACLPLHSLPVDTGATGARPPAHSSVQTPARDRTAHKSKAADTALWRETGNPGTILRRPDAALSAAAHGTRARPRACGPGRHIRWPRARRAARLRHGARAHDRLATGARPSGRTTDARCAGEPCRLPLSAVPRRGCGPRLAWFGNRRRFPTSSPFSAEYVSESVKKEEENGSGGEEMRIRLGFLPYLFIRGTCESEPSIEMDGRK